MKRRPLPIVLCKAILLTTIVAVVAYAGSSGSNLTVTAQVLETCTIGSGTVVFGNYQPTDGASASASAALSVACSVGTAAIVKLDQGANAAPGSTDALPLRRLTDGQGHFLHYALAQDSAGITTWGNTTATGKTYLAQSSAATPVVVYGALPANQNVTPGAYTDAVTVTVAF